MFDGRKYIMVEITVIIPVYNASQYVQRLLESLHSQSFQAFKTVFVDDASVDDSVSKLQNMCGKYLKSYEIVQLPENQGAGPARNTGMRYVEGSYFTFIDADDWVSENYLEELFQTVQSQDAEIVFSSGVKKYADGQEKTLYDLMLYQKYLRDKTGLLCVADYGPCGKLFAARLWNDEIQFPAKIRCEDLPTVTALIDQANRFAIAPNAKYFYYQSHNSRSRSNGKYFNDIFLSCQLMEERLHDKTAIEYHFLEAVGYGLLMNAILHKENNAVLDCYVDYLKKKFPNGVQNRYFFLIHPMKRLFIRLAYLKIYTIMRLMVKVAK